MKRSMWRGALSVLIAAALVVQPLPARAMGGAAGGSSTFADIAGHWASRWITYLVERGATTGQVDSSGRRVVLPERPLIWTEAFQLSTSLTSVSSGLAGTQAVGNVDRAFEDTARTVMEAHGKSSAWNSDSAVTRAEFISFVVRLYGQGLEGATPRDFTDVAESYWAAAEIRDAAAQGWVVGYQDGSCRPDALITRAEALTILARVDEQSLLTRTLQSLAQHSYDGNVNAYIDSSVTHAQSLVDQGLLSLPEGRLAALRELLNLPLTDPMRVSDENVLKLQRDLAADLLTEWQSGSVRRPGLVTGLAAAIMALRESADQSINDATVVLGPAGDEIPAPTSVSSSDWREAQNYLRESRQVYARGLSSLAKADAVGGAEAFLSAWRDAAAAITWSGVRVSQADADRDADGIPDELEIKFGANPLLTDTDNDGLTDSFEIEFGGLFFTPNNKDTDNNGTGDADEDADSDGLSNRKEQESGTNPLRADTDGDGLDDAAELRQGANPKVPDTDGDGVLDGNEIRLSLNPLQKDSMRTVTGTVQTSAGTVTVTGVASSVVGTVITAADQEQFVDLPGLVSTVTEVTAPGPIGSARVEIPVDHSAVQGKDTHDLKVFYFRTETQEWVPVEGAQGYDPATGRAWAETTHFTTFAVFYVPDWKTSWTVQQCINQREQGTPTALDLALAIDSSGSMKDNDPKDLRKQGAVTLLVSLLKDDRAAVIDFDSSARVVQSLTSDKEALKRAVQSIDADGGTSVDGGIRMGLSELAKGEQGRAQVLVILTDGKNDPDPFDAGVITQAVSAGVTIYTIGLGSSIDKPLLEEIAARTGGRFYQVQTATDLPKAFERVQSTIGVADFDDDGLNDCEEIQGMPDANGKRWYSNPNLRDSDSDGLTDRQELGTLVDPILLPGHSYSGPYWTVISNPLKSDSDGDGLDDLTELKSGTGPMKYDTDGDNLSDGAELVYGTDPLKRDTDGDGFTDGEEVGNMFLNPLKPDDKATVQERMVQYHQGMLLGNQCVQSGSATSPVRCQDSVSFRLGQITSSDPGFVPDTETLRKRDASFREIATNVAKGQFGEDERRWMIDKAAIIMLHIPGNSINLLCGLYSDKTAKKECAMALVQGLSDGFMAGVEGDLEAIKSIPDLPKAVWNGVKFVGKSAVAGVKGIYSAFNFEYRFITDAQFRTNVMQKVDELVRTLEQLKEQLPDMLDAFLSQAKQLLSQRVQHVSGLRSDSPYFDEWLLLYPLGWIGGIVTEIVAVTALTAVVGEAVVAIPKVQELLQGLRFLATSAFRISNTAVVTILRRFGFKGLEVTEELYKEKQVFTGLEKLLELGIDPEDLLTVLKAGLDPEALHIKTAADAQAARKLIAKGFASELEELARLDLTPANVDAWGADVRLVVEAVKKYRDQLPPGLLTHLHELLQGGAMVEKNIYRSEYVTANLAKLTEAMRDNDSARVLLLLQNITGAYGEYLADVKVAEEGGLFLVKRTHVNAPGSDMIARMPSGKLRIVEAKTSRSRPIPLTELGSYFDTKGDRLVFNMNKILAETDNLDSKSRQFVRDAFNAGNVEFEVFVNSPLGDKSVSATLRNAQFDYDVSGGVRTVKLIITQVWK